MSWPRILTVSALGLGLVLLLARCDQGTVWRSGDYSVGWMDSECWLSIDVDTGGGHGSVMHKVIAVGEDSKWIVAAQHPDGDEARTLYYFLAKADDEPALNADEIVQGPFTEAEFEEKRTALKLPEFAVWFH